VNNSYTTSLIIAILLVNIIAIALIYASPLSQIRLRPVVMLVVWLSGAITWFFGVYQFVYIEENAAIQGYEQLKKAPSDEKIKEAKENLKSTIKFLSQSYIRHLIRIGGVYAGVVPAIGIFTRILGEACSSNVLIILGKSIVILSLIVITIITTAAGCAFACFFMKHKPREKYLKALLRIEATKKQSER